MEASFIFPPTINSYRTSDQLCGGCDTVRKNGIEHDCHCRCLLREEVVDKTIFDLLRLQVFSPAWVETVVKAVREEISKTIVSVDSIVQPLQATVKRLSAQIDVAARRLVHVPEDVQEVYFEELRRLKDERDKLVTQIEESKKLADGTVNLDDVEQKIRERLSTLWRILEGDDEAEVRAELAKHIDRIEVDRNRRGWLYPKADGILADFEAVSVIVVGEPDKAVTEGVMRFGGIPTGI